MKSKSFFGFLLVVLLLTACESSVTNPPTTIDNSTTLAYSGGLNVTFDKGITEFNKGIRIINLGNNSYLLDLQMSVKTVEDLESQQASIQFDIPFTSDNAIFPVGNYVLTEEQIKSAYSTYELTKVNGDFARYNFEGISATLKIDESNAVYIKGGFILNMEQLYGRRMIDGQLEDVVLSSPVSLQSHFSLEF